MEDNTIYMIIIIVILLILMVMIMYWLIKNYIGSFDRYYNVKQTFPQLQIIENNFDIIKHEFETNQNNGFEDWPENELYSKYKGDEWTIIPIYGFNKWNNKILHRFPKTIEMLKDIKGLRTIIFSKLGPKTRLKKHRGWKELSNKTLRCHMGIKVPKNNRSGVEVEDEFKQVDEGKFIIFDDSKEHIGVNSSNEDRVVLLLDIERPWWVQNGRSNVGNTEELKRFLDNF